MIAFMRSREPLKPHDTELDILGIDSEPFDYLGTDSEAGIFQSWEGEVRGQDDPVVADDVCTDEYLYLPLTWPRRIGAFRDDFLTVQQWLHEVQPMLSAENLSRKPRNRLV